jgi:parallel beta-helix repeat protein
MKTAKKVLLSVSLITLSLALVLAPFTGAIEGDVTAGNTTDGVWDIVSDDILSDESLLASLGDSPTTWTVHPTDRSANFRTIQSALDKRLTIYSRDGADVTIVDAQGSGNALTIKADSCTVDGFMATGSGHYPDDAGIKIESNGNNIMNNICCANENNGIYLLKSSNNMISNNSCVVNNNEGISLLNSANNTISNNEIGDNNRAGIFLADSSDIMIHDNKIARNKLSGIYMFNSITNMISNNSCYENNGKGIYLAGCSNNTIKNNGIGDNDRGGIYMMGCTNNIISYNEIYDNFLDGLYISQSSDNVVTNNEICRNSQAGVHVASSWNNQIYCNDFVNSRNIDSDASYSIWDSMRVYTYNGSQYTSYISNYLSDYVGADNNSDGIGDEPYVIPVREGNDEAPRGIPIKGPMVCYPLIRPFKYYNLLPIADFTFSPLIPKVNERVTFDASLSYDPDGAIILYQWNFGDGKIASMAESTITHYYRSTADYAVTLTVTDDSGAISSTSKVITIKRFPKFTVLP